MTEKALLPDGWEMVRLGDMAEVRFSPVDKKTVDGEIPIELCNYTDVFYSRKIYRGMKFMSATAKPVELAKWELRKGDVLFTKDSETADEIGVPSYVADELPKVLCGYHLGLARPKATKVEGDYLAMALGSDRSRHLFSRIANGVTRFGLTLDATRKLPVLLPPLSEQRAIAEILVSIDESIESAEALIAATEQVRDSLLHELLTRGMPGWHTEWREVPGVGTVPASWEVVRLGEVAEVIMGQSPPGANVFELEGVRPNNSGLPFIQGNAEFGERVPAPVKWCVKPLKIALPGDTLVSVRAPVGDTNRVEEPLAIGRGLSAIRFRDLDPIYGWHLIGNRSDTFERVAQGSTFAAIGGQQLRELPIPLPPLPEQRAIASLIDGVDDAIVNQRAELALIQLFKVSTADALLTGQVRVGKENDTSNGTSE